MASDYIVIDEIRDEDGLVATITSKDVGGFQRFSYRIQREYVRPPGGPPEKTDFLRPEHVPAHRRLLDRVEERMRLETDRLHASRRARGRR